MPLRTRPYLVFTALLSFLSRALPVRGQALLSVLVPMALLLAATSLTAMDAHAGTPAPSEIAQSVCGDHDGNGRLGASDALIVLRKAVGEDVELICSCPSCPGSTTTTSVSTTTTTTMKSSVCGNGIVEPGEDCEPSNGLFCSSHCDETTGICVDIVCLDDCRCGG